jgi:hypothetical protein
MSRNREIKQITMNRSRHAMRGNIQAVSDSLSLKTSSGIKWIINDQKCQTKNTGMYT